PGDPRRKPVVVVAMEHDRRVRADPAVTEELAELLSAGDVAADPVGELARPVPPDGARDVALLVGGRVDVDLDEAHARIVEVSLGPVGVDEDVIGVSGNGHGTLLWIWSRAASRRPLKRLGVVAGER